MELVAQGDNVVGFLSGSVAYSRFRIVGGGPKRLDDHLLDKLREHAIGGRHFMWSDHEEVGWIGGQHLLDREFDVEKNVILDCLHFGMRLDASRVPPELMRAYVEMELQSLRAEEPSAGGKQFARLKKQAQEAARRRADREMKDGRFCRQRQFPMLLDTRGDVLFVGATQPAVQERLYPLFKETFGKRLEPLTSGASAAEQAEARGVIRALEQARASQFVAAPREGAEWFWTTHDPAARDFLGNEFLLWLWYTLAEESDTVQLPDQTTAAVMISNQLTLECPWGESGREVITSEGPAALPESLRAIRSGKLPRKAGLTIARREEQFALSLQAETFNVSGGLLPKPEAGGEPQARQEERLEQLRRLTEALDLLYGAFLARRLSSAWEGCLDRMKAWMKRG